jgi:hypothetical protein
LIQVKGILTRVVRPSYSPVLSFPRTVFISRFSPPKTVDLCQSSYLLPRTITTPEKTGGVVETDYRESDTTCCRIFRMRKFGVR